MLDAVREVSAPVARGEGSSEGHPSVACDRLQGSTPADMAAQKRFLGVCRAGIPLGLGHPAAILIEDKKAGSLRSIRSCFLIVRPVA